MLPSIKLRIDQNPNLKQYLREHSYWYKYLDRAPESITEMEKEMKASYHLTVEDKLQKFRNQLELLATFLDVLN